MNSSKQKLIIEQVDRKIAAFKPLINNTMPQNGWINMVRMALKMSLRQLSNRLKTSPQGLKGIEKREATGNITINTLKEVAEALDMKLVYGFIPKQESIEKIIDDRAYEVAKEIVMRTSYNMRLEDQENTNERLKKAIRNRAEEIKNTMPRYLWD